MTSANKFADEVSGFTLTWILMLTLFRKKILSKEDVLQTIDLFQTGGPESPVLSELRGLVENYDKPQRTPRR